MAEIRTLLSDIYAVLDLRGLAILSFRDYSVPLYGDARFIPVKSDEGRILTCVLDYLDDTVTVTDLLYERQGSAWTQKVSSYSKVRVRPVELEEILTSVGFRVVHRDVNRMITLIAEKQG